MIAAFAPTDQVTNLSIPHLFGKDSHRHTRRRRCYIPEAGQKPIFPWLKEWMFIVIFGCLYGLNSMAQSNTSNMSFVGVDGNFHERGLEPALRDVHNSYGRYPHQRLQQLPCQRHGGMLSAAFARPCKPLFYDARWSNQMIVKSLI